MSTVGTYKQTVWEGEAKIPERDRRATHETDKSRWWEFCLEDQHGSKNQSVSNHTGRPIEEGFKN